MDKVKWGIIGCGNVTEVKSGPAFNKIKNSELIAVMRRNSELAKDYAKRHNVPKWYEDADKLINDPEINAVYIATPPDTHAYYTIKTAEAGKPVYVEKPMARNYDECLKMIEACKENNVPLFVAYYRRQLPMFLKVKELVDNKEIGKILFVNVRLHVPQNENDYKNLKPWRVVPEISGGGHFVDLASHQLDYLDYLFGPIISTKSIVKNISKLYDAEDYVSASFEFENGIAGNGVWSFTSDENNRFDEIEITGLKGRIVFSTFEKHPIKIIKKNDEKIFNENFPVNIQQPLIETVVAELLGNGTCPSKGESASRTNKIIDSILMK